MRRAGTLAAAALLLGACSGGGGGGTPPTPPPPPAENPVRLLPTDREFALPGLSGRVDVAIDGSGIPHVYAETDRDGALVQGWLQARDRLFQMEVFRAIPQGRLSEIFPPLPEVLDMDFLYRGVMSTPRGRPVFDEIVEAMDPGLRDLLQGYADGVNAYLADVLAGRQGAALSPEYEFLARRADRIPPWRAEDTVAVGRFQSWELSQSLDAELELAEYKASLPDALLRDFVPFAPEVPISILPAAPAPAKRAPATGSAARLASLLPQLRDARAHLPRRVLTGGKGMSNSWVLAPALTGEGPILANDPHLQMLQPPTLYQGHLDAKTFGRGRFHVSGVTFPGAPGVVIGRNERCAWGETTAGYDVLDLYEEEIVPGPGGEPSVRLSGSLVPIQRREERFRLGNSDRFVTATLEYVPHHGPVLKGTRRQGSALTARWTGSEPTGEIEAFYRLNLCEGPADFAAAMEKFEVGAQNFVYADVDGNVAYRAPGRVPLRPGPAAHPPWLPQPGTGEAEWAGAVPPSDLPGGENPASGRFVTANNDLVGWTLDGDPLNDPGYYAAEHDIGFRAGRIAELLDEAEAAGFVTAEDAMRVQTDNLVQEAARILPHLLAAAEARPDLLRPRGRQALVRMPDWKRRAERGVLLDFSRIADPEIAAESIAASIFYAWTERLGRALFDVRTQALGLPKLAPERRTKALLRLLEGRSETGDALFDDPRTPQVESREETILAAFDIALGDLESPGVFATRNQDRWRWGALHRVTLSSFFDQAGVPLFINGPLPRAGGLFSVDIAAWDEGELPLKVAVGPNTRMVHRARDGEWETWNALPGGQNGVRGDPHFEDNLVFYLRGEYYKIPFRPQEVAAAAAEHWVFLPEEP